MWQKGSAVLLTEPSGLLVRPFLSTVFNSDSRKVIIPRPGKEIWIMSSEFIKEILPSVLTHLVAFLIFVWILKRLALKPVLLLLDERRDKIAKEFDQIATSEKRVNSLKEEYEDRLRKIDEEARKRSQEEVARGRRIADEIEENARTEAGDIVAKAQAKLQLEVDQARARLKDEIVNMTIQATQHLLKEKMDDAHHRKLVTAFINDLERQG